MSNSDPALRQQAEAVIAWMAGRLDESFLVRQIDEPIDRAVADFTYDDSPVFLHHRFHRVLGRFVGHIYAYGSPCPRKLSEEQARDEAVALLENLYQGTLANGYDAALIEARRDPTQGLEMVFLRLAEALKARRRQQYIQAVFARCLDPADWPLRCQIAAILLQRLQPWLPAEMAEREPAQFVDEIPTLFNDTMTMNALLQQVCADSVSFAT